MRFTPKTEEEIQADLLIEPGIYSFEVIEAHDKISKKGSDMIELKLKVWDSSGREKLVFDYLLEAMHFKLIHFAQACGLFDKYNSGEFKDRDCVGKCGKLELDIQEGQAKPDGGKYQPKNTVIDYIVAEDMKGKPVEAKKEEEFDDQIPF